MIAAWKEKLFAGMKRFSGRTDLLEAVCAATALVATADGKASDDELLAAKKAIKANAALASAFKDSLIDKTMDKMTERAGSGRTGRAGLYREIEEVAGSSDFERELVYLGALDVAESEGGISSEERACLHTIASKLGVNPSSLAAV